MLLGATAAGASNLIHVTYTGQATDVQDLNGLFGAPGSFTSTNYTADYVFDLDVGQRWSNSDFDEILGGSAFGAPTPLVSSSLTMNGHTVSFVGDYTGQELNQVGAFTESYAISRTGGTNAFLFNQLHFDAPYAVETTFTAAGSGWGAFYICPDGPNGCAAGQPETLKGWLAPVSMTVTAIPEPGTWALAIVGMGMAGSALRRRRRAVAA
jgi:hypothetical protein